MTTFASHITKGTHAARPAATAVPSGSLYSCSDHSLIYQSDGAAWSTYATLGGSSAVPTVSASRTAGDVTISYVAPAGTFTAVDTGLDLTIPAATGDVIELVLSGLMAGHSTGSSAMNVNFTAKTRVSGADVNNVAPSPAVAVPGWFTPDVASALGGTFKINGSHLYTVQAGDISGGNVTFRLYYQADNAGSATRTLYAATATLPLTVYAKNLRH